MNKAQKFLYQIFGIDKPKKIKTGMKCGVVGCNNPAKYQNGDGLLSFWFVCEEHKNIQIGEPIKEKENE